MITKILFIFKLSASARIYSHVGVDLQHHVLVLVEEEDAEGRHFLRDAARLRDAGHDAHRPHDALDGGMVGGPQGLQRGREGFNNGGGNLVSL